MGPLHKIFNKENKSENNLDSKQSSSNEHSVIIKFNYGLENLDPLFELEDELETALQNNNVGDCDGHEIATDLSDGVIFLYGSNAETVFKTAKPILEKCSFMENATAKLRFGPPEEGVREIYIKL